MTIKVGDKLPDVKLVKATAEGPQPVQSSDYFAGRKVALFSVPGAFTPTCSARHLPGFVEKADELKAKGIDEIACTAVNDAFVLGAWNKSGGSDAITMLADGNADFCRSCRPHNGRLRLWHGQARPAFLDGRQRWRSRADQCRSTRRFQGKLCRSHARPALTRS
jgi:peroxiredoxin